MAEDELHQAREHFYVGSYAKAVELAESVMPSNDIVQAERDSLLLRAKLAQGNASACAGFEHNSSAALKAVALFAQAKQGNKAAGDALATLAASQEPTAKMLASCAFAAEDNMAEAHRLAASNPTLEMKALRAQLLMQMERPELAEQLFHEMSVTDDDAAVTKLTGALVHIGSGNFQESYLTYCDLQALYQAGDDAPEARRSVALLTGKAVANMQRKQWQEAFEDLTRARLTAPNDAVVLANLVCVCQHMRKTQEAEDFLKVLGTADPSHPFVQSATRIRQAFQRFGAQ